MSPKEIEALRERMSKQSDEDLLKIVNVNFKDYRKEAIELARAEVKKRGLSHRLATRFMTPDPPPRELTEEDDELTPNEEASRCKFCGAAISATATECRGCGYGTPYGIKLEEERELKEAAARNAIALINCPACNGEVSNQAVACPKCGHPIKAEPAVKVSPQRTFIPLKGKRRYSAGAVIGLGIIGFLIGGGIGFALRPSVPFIGQLPFEVVITQGSNLRGLDQVLVHTAQISFTYMMAGAVLGTLGGMVVGALLSKPKS